MPSEKEQLKEQVETSIKLTNKMLDQQDGLEAKIKELEAKGEGTADLKEKVAKMSEANADAIDEIKSLQDELVDRQDEIETKAKSQMNGHSSSSIKANWQKAVDEYNINSDWKGRADIKVDLDDFEGKSRKNITDADLSAGPLLIPQYDQQVLPLGRQGPTIRDLLNARTTTATTIVYWRHKETTAGAATQENQMDLKQQTDMSWEEFTAQVGTIAVWTYVSRQMLDDVGFLRGTIEGELRFLVEIEEDRQLLKGDGLNGDMEGINEVATAFDTAVRDAIVNDSADTQQFDVLAAALHQVQLTHFPPTGIILHPTDSWSMKLLKDDSKGYLFANPNSSNGIRPWGYPVAETTQQDQGDFTVGAFNFVDYWQRQAVRVEVSTEDGDNFRRNRATVLAEKRAGVAPKRPYTIVKGDFDTALTPPA